MNLIETPSGKTHKEENFPVGSWLLPKELRKEILVFYDFARAADDISDNPNLIGKEKIKRLNLFELTLKNKKVEIEKAHKIKKICEKHKIKIDHTLNLLKAFKQDVVKNRYDTFEDVFDYCRHSADPVGRLLLHLTQHATPQNLSLSDNICTGLQLINFHVFFVIFMYDKVY